MVQSGNYIRINESGIALNTPQVSECKIPLIKFSQRIYSDFGEAITFWLSIYSIPSFTLRMPIIESKKLDFRWIIIYVFIIIACCSIIYLPWTICSQHRGLNLIEDYIDNTMKIEKDDIVLKVVLGFKSLQQILIITLFGRYVLYEMIDMINEKKNNSGEMKLGRLHLAFTIFIIIITMGGFGYSYTGNEFDTVYIPFRINGVLILISSYFLPILYY